MSRSNSVVVVGPNEVQVGDNARTIIVVQTATVQVVQINDNLVVVQNG